MFHHHPFNKNDIFKKTPKNALSQMVKTSCAKSAAWLPGKLGIDWSLAGGWSAKAICDLKVFNKSLQPSQDTCIFSRKQWTYTEKKQVTTPQDHTKNIHKGFSSKKLLFFDLGKENASTFPELWSSAVCTLYICTCSNFSNNESSLMSLTKELHSNKTTLSK